MKVPFRRIIGAPYTQTKTRLSVTTLEERAVPAVSIVFDYRYDATNFFDTQAKRDRLQAVGDAVGARLNDTLTPIVPSGSNTWTATFFNPSTGGNQTLSNLVVNGNTIIVFVGARDLQSSELGLGGSGGFSAGGNQAWFNILYGRGQANTQGAGATDYGPWGGSISFDTAPGLGGWYFGTEGRAIRSNEFDFFSVASHELGHVLGLGLSNAWSAKLSGNSFVGSNAVAAYGAAVPISSDRDHWAQGVRSDGVQAAMSPVISAGVQSRFTSLDLAALADIGWQVSTGGGSTTPPPSPTPPPTGAAATAKFIAVSGGPGTDGIITLYNPDGAYRSTITAFAGFRGGVRTAAGDLNGDGYDDLFVAAGPGGGPHVKVFDGKTGTELRSFFAYDPRVSVGLSIAAGDVNGDGKADIITAPLGLAPHVQAFDGVTGTVLKSFYAFDSRFGGGVNVAAGDLNGDGKADIVAAPASGGGPNVVAFDSATNNLIKSFYAYDPLFGGGVFVAVADVDGDGRADIVTGAGSLGGSHVKAFSGRTDALLASFLASSTQNSSGIRVAAKDLDGNGKAEIITASGSGATPDVVAFSAPASGTAKPSIYKQLTLVNVPTGGAFVS